MTAKSMGAPFRPRFLASVTSAAEAAIALAGGAEIIDAKDPASGALGALPVATVRAIVETVAGVVPVSATIGDLVPEPALITAATYSMAATGVDMVKIGLFEGGDARASIRALAALDLGPVRRVGLLLADRDPDFTLIEAMADAGFAGVMLDTASKDGRALPDVLPAARLGEFVARAQAAGMFAGLAGALRQHHISAVTAHAPDVVGFRGALCSGGHRQGPLEEDAVRRIAVELQTGGRPASLRPAALKAAS